MLPVGYKFKVVSAVKLLQTLEAGKVGRAKNTALALERRKRYNESPNLCLDCKNPILVPMDSDGGRFSEIKKKKFCNHSCGAKYHNRVFGYPHRKPKVRICSVCGASYTSPHSRSTRCSECKHTLSVSVLASRTKGESLVQEIRTHARRELFRVKEHKCEVCGYRHFVDCCHVKPIREFPNTSLLSEINAQSNLIALCRNHHAEFDLYGGCDNDFKNRGVVP